MTVTPPPLWTGKQVTALQNALRLTNEQFAAALTVSCRSVATWRARPAMVPRPKVQQLLDKALFNADPVAQGRFALAVGVDLPPILLPEEQRAEVIAVLDHIWARLNTLEAAVAGRDAIASHLHKISARVDQVNDAVTALSVVEAV